MKEIIYGNEMKQIVYIHMNGKYLHSHLVVKTALGEMEMEKK